MLLAIGLLFAYFAHAQSNNELNKPFVYEGYSNTQLDWQKTTLFNTSGYIVEPPVLEPPVEKKPIKTPLGKDFCSCVAWVKAQTGYTKIVGAAKNWPINSLVPQIGSVVVTSESSWGHVAIVTDIRDGFLVLAEANYKKCSFTEGRKLSIKSPLIKGYYGN